LKKIFFGIFEIFFGSDIILAMKCKQDSGMCHYTSIGTTVQGWTMGDTIGIVIVDRYFGL
jgi:hypothetical protein